MIIIPLYPAGTTTIWSSLHTTPVRTSTTDVTFLAYTFRSRTSLYSTIGWWISGVSADDVIWLSVQILTTNGRAFSFKMSLRGCAHSLHCSFVLAIAPSSMSDPSAIFNVLIYRFTSSISGKHPSMNKYLIDVYP